MFIVIVTISIFAITGFIWLLNRILPFKICPICAGVSGTWLWTLAAKFLGYEIDMLILAMLMGGSVVGIAYQIEKRLPARRSPLLWKILFIPVGFIAVYSILANYWSAFIIALIFLLQITLIFLSPKKEKGKEKGSTVEELENKMENCC